MYGQAYSRGHSVLKNTLLFFSVSFFQVCNGDVYLTIPSHDMHLLYLHIEESLKGTNPNETESSDKESSHTMEESMKSLEKKFLDYGVDYATGTVLGTKANVQVMTVPEPMFKKIDLFYCCAHCGKVFWEGTHFERVCEQYSHVLSLNQSNLSVYDRLNSSS